MSRRIAVVGTGYVGTVVAACFGWLGADVVAVEVDERKLETLRQGRAPFFEPGLDELLADTIGKGRLSFTNDVASAVRASDIVFLCVGTPKGENGGSDLTWVERAARDVGAALDRYHVLVTKSTVPIGNSTWLSSLLEDSLPEGVEGDLFSIVSNPEFQREGSAVEDFLHPDRVVVGSDDRAAMEQVLELYQPILDQSFPGGDPSRRPPVIRTSLTTAETVKYAANAFLATKISFINEIANICDLVGADVSEVAAALGLDHRISPSFFEPGLGWGGSCLPKDVQALMATAREHGYEPRVLQAAFDVNQYQRTLIVNKLHWHLHTLPGRRIGLLGLSFKPGTDDLRESPALDIARRMIAAGCIVTGFDPLVREVPELPDLRVADDAYDAADRADAVVVATGWPEFLSLELQELIARMRGDLFIDARNLFDPAVVRKAGLRYDCIGRTSAQPRPSLQNGGVDEDV